MEYKEGGLYRLSDGSVYLIKNGELVYQSYLTKEQWATVVDVGYSTKKSFFDVIGIGVKNFFNPKKAVEEASKDPLAVLEAGEVMKKAVVTIGSVVGAGAIIKDTGIISKMKEAVKVKNAEEASKSGDIASKANDVLKFDPDDYQDPGDYNFDELEDKSLFDKILEGGTGLIEKMKNISDKVGAGGGNSSPGSNVKQGSTSSGGIGFILLLLALLFLFRGSRK